METTAFSEDSPQFFKIFFPDHCSTQLRIPPKFMKNFTNTKPFKSTLRTSDERSWQVDVIKDGRYLFFKNGWNEFVLHYSIKDGDFLLFYYSGNALFDVTIFGLNSLPKQLPTCIDSKDIEENIQAPGTAVNCDNPSFEIVMKKTYIKGQYMTVPLWFWKKYMREDKDTAKLNHSNRSWEVKLLRNLHSDRTNFTIGWPNFVKDNHLREYLVCKFELISSNDYVFNVSIRKSDSKSESTPRRPIQLPERTDNIRAVNSNNPSFEKVLKTSYVKYGYMSVPIDFAESYMTEVRTAKLIYSGKLWEVEYKSHTQRFTVGWTKFARENKLRENSMCKFELISTTDFVFNVTIQEPGSRSKG